MKKVYLKPTTCVIKLQQHHQLLQASDYRIQHYQNNAELDYVGSDDDYEDEDVR
ncbi:MAG: hypothetical protein IKQ05_01985 [Prevotella sp.]|nr:hypothetical protein [Prevotella sp.]